MEVIPQDDGFPIYKSWIRNASDPDPVYECCELLSPLFLANGCHLPTGTKIRIDVRVYDRTSISSRMKPRTINTGSAS